MKYLLLFLCLLSVGCIPVVADNPLVLDEPIILTSDTPVAPEVTPQVTPQVGQLLRIITGEHSRQELQEMLGLADREHFRKAYLLPALEKGWIEPTLPDKPTSRLQKYRLTEKGRGLWK